MRVVCYGKGSAYVLSDRQFDAAMGEWNAGRSVWIKSLEALLPPPKMPSGVPPEHKGLRIGYVSYVDGKYFSGLPGWLGINDMTKEVFVRRVSYGDETRSYWQPLNIREPHKIGNDGPAFTKEEIEEFVKKSNFLDVDVAIENLHPVSTAALLPSYFQP